MPEGERWNADAISNMQGAPSRPSATMPGLHIPIAMNIEQGNLDGAQWKLLKDKKRKRPEECI